MPPSVGTCISGYIRDPRVIATVTGALTFEEIGAVERGGWSLGERATEARTSGDGTSRMDREGGDSGTICSAAARIVSSGS